MFQFVTYPIASIYGIFAIICLHLVGFYGKCRQIYHTWMVLVSLSPSVASRCLPIRREISASGHRRLHGWISCRLRGHGSVGSLSFVWRFLNMWNLRGYETKNKHRLAAIDKDHQTETLIFCPYFPQLIEISAVVLLRIHSLIQHLQAHGGIMKLWHCMPKRNFPQQVFCLILLTLWPKTFEHNANDATREVQDVKKKDRCLGWLAWKSHVSSTTWRLGEERSHDFVDSRYATSKMLRLFASCFMPPEPWHSSRGTSLLCFKLNIFAWFPQFEDCYPEGLIDFLFSFHSMPSLFAVSPCHGCHDSWWDWRIWGPSKSMDWWMGLVMLKYLWVFADELPKHWFVRVCHH